MTWPPNGLILAPVVWLVIAIGCGGPLHAHALQPGYLELREIGEDLYAAIWKRPSVKGRPMPILVHLPAHCAPATPGPAVWDGFAYVARWTATCPGGLESGVILIEGLDRTSTDVLVRFELADGGQEARRLTAGNSSLVVPAQPGGLAVVRTYFLLGLEHILLGIDHLLFVLALLLLVRGTRRIVLTVTAFTLAHSITLAGVTLGFLRVPGPPVEAAIALSIAFVAAEILHARRGRPGLTERYPWVVAFTFGLLHGFGFGGALIEIGLPLSSIPLALLLFNLGVEAGQLLFIAAALGLVALIRRVQALHSLQPPQWAGVLPPYVIGSLAMVWVLQRLAAF